MALELLEAGYYGSLALLLFFSVVAVAYALNLLLLLWYQQQPNGRTAQPAVPFNGVALGLAPLLQLFLVAQLFQESALALLPLQGWANRWESALTWGGGPSLLALQHQLFGLLLLPLMLWIYLQLVQWWLYRSPAKAGSRQEGLLAWNQDRRSTFFYLLWEYKLITRGSNGLQIVAPNLHLFFLVALAYHLHVEELLLAQLGISLPQEYIFGALLPLLTAANAEETIEGGPETPETQETPAGPEGPDAPETSAVGSDSLTEPSATSTPDASSATEPPMKNGFTNLLDHFDGYAAALRRDHQLVAEAQLQLPESWEELAALPSETQAQLLEYCCQHLGELNLARYLDYQGVLKRQREWDEMAPEDLPQQPLELLERHLANTQNLLQRFIEAIQRGEPVTGVIQNWEDRLNLPLISHYYSDDAPNAADSIFGPKD